jgi:hypothetical protein
MTRARPVGRKERRETPGATPTTSTDAETAGGRDDADAAARDAPRRRNRRNGRHNRRHAHRRQARRERREIRRATDQHTNIRRIHADAIHRNSC